MKCLTCGSEVVVGKWVCLDGVNNHVVETKIYRCCDAPQEPGYGPGGKKLETSSYGETVVCNVPPPKKVMENNEVKFVGEGSVVFFRGRFSTSDPEKQYWLDQKAFYNATEEQWSANWLSEKQQIDMQRIELDAARQRLENERNELLAQTKQRVKVPA